ncbi:hypothetical protein AMJ80_00375 [bacterium SM23_31]|nr:MAG: hypothetical protein AMJ80_00375 [bacterium SM23_31]
MHKTLDELAKIVNGTVIGDGGILISDVTRIEEGEAGKISFLANPRYEKYLKDTKASAVIVPRSISEAKTNLLQVDEPYLAFRTIILLFYPFPGVSGHSIHTTAYIEKSAQIERPVQIGAFAYVGNDVRISRQTVIGAHAFIGNDVHIGEHVFLHPGVTILNRCIIGNRVIIHAGTVIGSDGFGFAKDKEKYLKIPQVGNVVIDDDVEIGANSAIDRATIGSTYIARGCKLDNLVHIAHNVKVGENTAIAGQTGIAGSTIIGSGVALGGQAGAVDHIEIGDNSIIGAQSGVLKSVPKNSFYFGFPARDHKHVKKIEAYMKKLPDMYERIKQLEKKINHRKSRNSSTNS